MPDVEACATGSLSLSRPKKYQAPPATISTTAAHRMIQELRDKEQLRRFKSRHRDPLRRWKLSPMDLESIKRWEDYSRAKDEMMLHTDTPTSPWFVVESDVKKHARLNMIAHLLSSIPYAEVPSPDVELPRRLTETSDYQRPPREQYTYVPDHASTLLGDPEAAR